VSAARVERLRAGSPRPTIEPGPGLPPEARRTATAMLVVGIALAAAGGLVAAPRIGPTLLLVAFYLVGLSLAGLFFVALSYVCDATWSVAIRRVPEAMARVVPACGVLMLAVVAAGGSMYPWIASGETLEGFKGVWLQRPFFVVRAGVYVGLWSAFAMAIVGVSRRQDQTGGLPLTRRNGRLSAAFLVVFAVTFWLASVDWIMSLEPHWASTMFGLYNFAGLFQSGLAALIVLVVAQRRRGLRGAVTDDHVHDLGKLLFAFSSFWMYIWFSQYMLIWYANIPEEAVYVVRRTQPGWLWLVLASIALNWVVPFVALMSRAAKRRPDVLVKVAAVVLVGRWIDLYLMIAPASGGAAATIGPLEIGAAVGGLSLFALAWDRAFAGARPVPVRDPFLQESLHYH
jgi:hypothetical protein